MAGTVFEFGLHNPEGGAVIRWRNSGPAAAHRQYGVQMRLHPAICRLAGVFVKWSKEAGGPVVIGVPSNDFGNQEPGEAEAIGEFCDRNYGVTFPMMAKAHVKGPEAASAVPMAGGGGRLPGQTTLEFLQICDGAGWPPRRHGFRA